MSICVSKIREVNKINIVVPYANWRPRCKKGGGGLTMLSNRPFSTRLFNCSWGFAAGCCWIVLFILFAHWFWSRKIDIAILKDLFPNDLTVLNWENCLPYNNYYCYEVGLEWNSGILYILLYWLTHYNKLRLYFTNTAVVRVCKSFNVHTDCGGFVTKWKLN